MNREGYRRWVACLAVALAVSACSGPQKQASSVATVPVAPADPWVLTTLNSNDPTPALLWNGLVGFRIGRDGGGAKQSFFAIDQYETSGEEKIQRMDSPLPNGFLLDGKPLPITGGYKQTLDMRTAELTTQWNSGNLTVKCVTVLHPRMRIIAERWTLTGAVDMHYVDFELGRGETMGQESLLETSIAIGPSKIKGKLIATKTLSPNPSVDFVLSLAPSPASGAMSATRPIARAAAPDPAQPPSLQTFQMVDDTTKTIWQQRWTTDIEIDGPVEDQQAVRSFLFYLRSAIAPRSNPAVGVQEDPAVDMSISPFGLSDATYNGHVFWDADMWVFPALMLLDPDEAKAIPEYRLATEPKAEANAKAAGIPSGVKYPWESSVTGSETVPGPSQKEIHITGDVAWSLDQAAALGLVPADRAKDVVSRAAAFFEGESKLSPDKSHREIKGVMSPDENHIGDNDLFTNLLAQWTANGGSWTSNPRTPVYQLPRDGQSFLTYDDDPLKGYKQAAAVLSIYPLQYPDAEKQARVMMDRFASKVTKNGPAMSDSVHSLIWARIGERDKAYQAWRDSWMPFTRQPLMLFSEKRTKPATYFTTGAAGSLQTVLFGFLGFRLDSTTERDAVWAKRLNGSTWLSVMPNLPPEWKSVKLKNFTVMGRRFSLTATHRPSGPDSGQVIQGD